MTERLSYYIGYDPRDTLAFEVAAYSCLKHASIPVEIIPVKEWELRQAGLYWRPFHVTDKGQRFDDRCGTPSSTDFSVTRFCVPLMAELHLGWVLWSDPDVLWRADIAELMALADDDKGAMVVQHRHEPPENVKMTGTVQRHYLRKNWTSVMLLNPAWCQGLTKFVINNETKDNLQAMTWLPDEQIGALPEEWNWLCGWSAPPVSVGHGPAQEWIYEPKLVHFTRGTPDMSGHEDEPYAEEWRQALEDSGVRLASFPRAGR